MRSLRILGILGMSQRTVSLCSLVRRMPQNYLAGKGFYSTADESLKVYEPWIFAIIQLMDYKELLAEKQIMS